MKTGMARGRLTRSEAVDELNQYSGCRVLEGAGHRLERDWPHAAKSEGIIEEEWACICV